MVSKESSAMNILLLVSGSISAYKSIEISRDLIKKGHHLKVCLTKGAERFVKPELFLYLGCEEVYTAMDDFNPKKKGVLHVELCQWADRAILAPLSAGCLARLVKSKAHDLVSSVFLAWQKSKPFLIAPAMNSEMWSHPFTQENLNKVLSLPWVGLIPPADGLLACGDIGPGKLPDHHFISELVTCFNPLKKINKTIIITLGATVAPIDSVRYVTNPSTGKTGFEIAKSFLNEGHDVHLLIGHQADPLIDSLKFHPRAHLHYTPTTELMRKKAHELFSTCDLYISTAAVADIEFDVSPHKLKKSDLHSLPIKGAVDILAEMLAQKKPHQKVISFGAESFATEDIFREKMQRKPVDLMVGNLVHNGLISNENLRGFSKDHGTYYFVLPHKTMPAESLTKNQLAQKLFLFSEQGHL
jgi:phosphopantothenoylcysteine decarboxylase/phosphopantothenate--cysteine ligase